MFTSAGASQLFEGLKQEASEILDDSERLQHFGCKSTVQVITTFVPGAQIVKLKHLGDVAQATAKALNEALPNDVIKLLKKLKDANRYKPSLIKAIENLFDEMDPRLLERLANVDGFEKVIEDMAQYWTKFRGGKFQLEYASRLIDEGGKIKFEVSNLSDNLRRIYDIELEKVVNGQLVVKRLELKNWEGFHSRTVKTQFVKDLVKMDEIGDIQWIFNKTSGVGDMQTLKRNVINSLKKANGNPIDELYDLFNDKSVIDKFKRVFDDDNLLTAKDLLLKLEENKVFELIFEIVD